MTVIDIHTHMFGNAWREMLGKHGKPDYDMKMQPDNREYLMEKGAPACALEVEAFDFDARVKAQDADGIDLGIVSLTSPNVFWGGEDVSVETARRFNDAVTGLFLKAAPDLMAAPTPGTQLVFVLAEFDASGVGRNVTILQPLSGGMGAYRGHDGVDCRDSTMSNMSNHCIEFVEADCGVIIREYDIHPDSG